jgi:hypothetical protein
MKEAVYLETTVVRYYTAKPTQDIITLAHQEIKRQDGLWRSGVSMCISQKWW